MKPVDLARAVRGWFSQHMKSLVLFVATALVVMEPVAAESRPNFLMILLDDSGWTDFGCYGSDIDTPNIDRVAKQGMRFSDCHSAAPNCSPSRTGLLTGRTPSRVGMYSYIPPNHPMHLPAGEITVAKLLKFAGYHTGHFGKWHVSKLLSGQPQPADLGFDYSLGTDNNASPSHHNPKNFVRNGEEVGPTKGYSCQIIVDETMRWLDAIDAGNSEDPFLACVWFHEPHTPIASPPDLVAKYQQKFPQLKKKEATYYANIENVDRAVGRLMKRLDELKIADDTLVFITSDNGPLNEFSKRGLRGKKSHVWEGGHRVPGIFRWPGRIKAGSVNSTPICGVDYLPTVCEIAGVGLPSDRTIDGTSIWPALQGKDIKRANPMYWFFYRLLPAVAMRDGDWVLIANTDDAKRPKTHQLIAADMPLIKNSKLQDFELFNLKHDRMQQSDVASSEPKVLDRLKKKMIRFHEDVVKDGPFWQIPEDYGKGKKPRLWLSR